jgi:hypothetical protein
VPGVRASRLSILVRKLLKRGDFRSLDDLRDQILAFISYYNHTMAKPIKWTYTGLPTARCHGVAW